MAWLCNDQQQKSLFRRGCWCVWALAERRHLPAELLAYKGASQSQSPATGSCTWLPLGVLATQFCGRAPKETVTHRQQMACVVFHPSAVPPPALGYTSLCAERYIRAGNPIKQTKESKVTLPAIWKLASITYMATASYFKVGISVI